MYRASGRRARGLPPRHQVAEHSAGQEPRGEDGGFRSRVRSDVVIDGRAEVRQGLIETHTFLRKTGFQIRSYSVQIRLEQTRLAFVDLGSKLKKFNDGFIQNAESNFFRSHISFDSA